MRWTDDKLNRLMLVGVSRNDSSSIQVGARVDNLVTLLVNKYPKYR